MIFFSLPDQKRVNLLLTIKYNQKTYAYGKIVVWDKNANSDFNKKISNKKLTDSKIVLANQNLHHMAMQLMSFSKALRIR